MKRKRRLWLKVSAVLAGLFVALALAAWCFPQQVLTRDSGAVKADVLVVLGGGSRERLERPERAADLFKAGEAPLILCSGNADAGGEAAFFTNHGVPLADIRLESQSRTTRENAQFSIPLLRTLGARRVIIVTSWFHSRRALACFQHYAPDLTFYSRPSYEDYPRTDWDRHKIRAPIQAEYGKILGYWVCYGICPL